jgi:DNA helicase-2/ATP-dependent DNA helicase PcrA
MVAEHVRSGVPPDQIAAVTFTRSAAREIVQRVGRDLGQAGFAMIWARTIHSMAYRLLRVERGRMMSGPVWKEFGKRYGYDFTDAELTESDEGPKDLPTATGDDLLRHAYEWGRARCFDLAGTLDGYEPQLPKAHLTRYVERYEAFKVERGLRDFADLLEAGWQVTRPPVRVAFVDEAQDLSPAQIRCVESWFGSCEELVVIGDADQAIFAFQGASPDWVTGLAKQHSYEVLEQSYRVPMRPHALARAVILQNKDRIDAAYRPRPALGAVETLPLAHILDRIVPTTPTFILVRNRMFMAEPADYCLRRGWPFEVEGFGGPCPYRRHKVVAAIRCACALEQHGACAVGALTTLLDFVVSRPADGQAPLVALGMKTRIRDHHYASTLTATEIAEAGGARLLLEIQQHGPLAALQRDLSDKERAYWAALVDEYGEVPEPKVILTTIHGSKGREADVVVVIPDMAGRTARAYRTPEGEAEEHRIFYVAATRTRETLYLATPSTPYAYRWPRVDLPTALPVALPLPPAIPMADFSATDLGIGEGRAPRSEITWTPPAAWDVEVCDRGVGYQVWRIRHDDFPRRITVLARTGVGHPPSNDPAYTVADLQTLVDLEVSMIDWCVLHARWAAFAIDGGNSSITFERALAWGLPNWQTLLERARQRRQHVDA